MATGALVPLPRRLQAWNALGGFEPDREYLVVVAFLALALWRVPWFLRQTGQVFEQVEKAAGVVGYAPFIRVLIGRGAGGVPLRVGFGTLSAWRDEAALAAFVRAPPHARLMSEPGPRIGRTRFLRRTAVGRDLPPRWDEVRRRWDAA